MVRHRCIFLSRRLRSCIIIYRCFVCGKGLDTTVGAQRGSCPECGANRWMHAGQLHWYESVKLWRETGVWFVGPDSKFAKMLLFIDKITPGKTKWL